MIIKYIEIHSFGKLNNFKLTPSGNLNTFCEENGYGKSTICDFIVSMLYGLNKKSKTDFSREHYLSFSTNSASGILEVFHNNITYKIVRKFKKSQSLDELYFYENNNLNNNVLIPGEYILDINKESFLRTIYFNSINFDLTSNLDIKNKMNHYIENTKEDFNINDILSKIDGLKKEIIPLKLQDEKGLIANCKGKIKSLENEIINRKSLETTLKSNEITLKDLKDNLELLQKKYKDSACINEIISNNIKYNNDLSKLNEYKKEIEFIEKKYNNRMPSDEEINSINELYNQKKDILINITSNKLPLSLEDKYKEYSLIFKNDMQNEFININNKILEYDNLNTNKDININYELITKYDNTNFLSIINEAESLNNDYLNIEEQLQSINVKNNDTINKPHNVFNIILYMSLFIILFGIIIGIFISSRYFVITILGFIGLLISFYNHLNAKINLSNKSNNLEDFKVEYDNIKNKIDSILFPYGFSSLKYNTISNAIYSAKEEYHKYLEELDKLKAFNDNTLRLNDLIKELKLMYRKYNIFEEDFKANYNILLQKYSDYNILKDKIQSIHNLNEEFNIQIEEINKKLDYYINMYNISDLNLFLKELNEDSITYNIKTKSYNTLSFELEEFKTKFKVSSEFENLDYINIEQLSSEISNNNAKINRLIDDIDDINDKLDNLSYLEDDLYNENIRLNYLNNRYSILSITKEKLLKANDNLNNKYLFIIKERFNNYLNIIGKNLDCKFIMTESLDVFIDDGGILRNYKHLSLGQMTLVCLCYRLAICDSIFKENYFIILDDLFVNLDDNNLTIALNLIKQLSFNKQIFYFTCHNSRKI